MGHIKRRDDGGCHPPRPGHRIVASRPQPPPPSPPPPLIARMASSLKTFLACSLLTFVSVHATQRLHPRDTLTRAISAPTVTVKNGTYQGLYSTGYDQDFFLGMRYAQVRSSQSFPALPTDTRPCMTAGRALPTRPAPELNLERDTSRKGLPTLLRRLWLRRYRLRSLRGLPLPQRHPAVRHR